MTYYRDTQFDSVLLESEQRELLEELVEAARRLSRHEREKFMLVATMERTQPELLHPGIPEDHPGVYEGDLDALVNEQMLTQTAASDGTPLYDVSPRGYKYYAHLQIEKGAPSERVERRHREYIDAAGFQKRYPSAYAKWKSAENELWQSDSAASLSTIGHLCREAIQDFCHELLRNRGLNGDSDKSKTVSRLRAVIAATPRLSAIVADHSIALLSYAGTLIDVVQRQEHGAAKDGPPLQWDDGRRVVFQTLVVLSELDRELGHA